MFILLFLVRQRESSKSKRVRETETASIYLSLRSLMSDATVDCTQHYISVLDDWNVAILLLLHTAHFAGENRGCQKRWHKKENNIARNEDFVDFGKAHKFAHYANDILSNLVGYCKNIYYCDLSLALIGNVKVIKEENHGKLLSSPWPETTITHICLNRKGKELKSNIKSSRLKRDFECIKGGEA